MAQITENKRAVLQAQLRALALIQDTLSGEDIDVQISQLLAEVLIDEPLSAPLALRTDDESEDQRPQNPKTPHG